MIISKKGVVLLKSKIMAGVLMFIIISVLLTGCGGKQKEIPYPDGYYVPKPEETETAGKSDKSQGNDPGESRK